MKGRIDKIYAICMGGRKRENWRNRGFEGDTKIIVWEGRNRDKRVFERCRDGE